MKSMLPLSERISQHPSLNWCFGKLVPAALLLTALAVLGGCTASRVVLNPDDYVEVDNPFAGDSPDANAKIWVPRKSLEQGVPRGGALVKKGYDALAGKTGSGGAQAGATAALQDVRTTRPRLLVAEEKGSHLGVPFRQLLGQGCLVRPVAGEKSVPDTDQDRIAYLASLSAQPGGGPALLLAAPQGTGPGAQLKAELYDVRGPLLLRSFTITIPQPEKDESTEEATVRSLSGLSGAILDVLNRIPWYGRVVSVTGDRVYFDAGAESGLKPGQKLSVRRGGEAVKGVGFASGPRITSISINELVGPDGSYGISPEAAKVLPGDYVELEN